MDGKKGGHWEGQQGDGKEERRKEKGSKIILPSSVY